MVGEGEGEILEGNKVAGDGKGFVEGGDCIAAVISKSNGAHIARVVYDASNRTTDGVWRQVCVNCPLFEIIWALMDPFGVALPLLRERRQKFE